MPRPSPLVRDPCLLDVSRCPDRIQKMIGVILRHQDILCAYETGSLELHYNGSEVRPQLVKVSLNSCMESAP